MNNVNLIGRMTRDIEIRYTDNKLAIGRFALAVDRVKKGEEKNVDFVNILVFGKQAENIEKYTGKGKLIGITGRIQTGSYTNKEGSKVYTTDVVADRVTFINWNNNQLEAATAGFSELSEDDIPF